MAVMFYIVLLFVAGSRSIKKRFRGTSCSVACVNDVSGYMALFQEVLSDFFYVGGVMKVF